MDAERENHLENLSAFTSDELGIVRRIIRDPAMRIAAVERSLSIFFAVYLNHYLEYPTAPFQHQMLALAEDPSERFLVIEAFRGSGKSSLVALGYILWSILGFQRKKHILIVSGTMEQVALLMRNIRIELEENDLLKRDLGPFEEEANEWRVKSFFIPKYNARVMGISREALSRGARRREHRPDVILCDDIENLELLKTREGRDNLQRWFTSDLIPMGNPESTKYILLGTHLHGDSLLERLGKQINDGERDGVFRRYPFIDEHGNAAWPSRYPTPESIESVRRLVGDQEAWDTEYMLRTPVGDRQLVRPEWLRVYAPEDHPGFGADYGYRNTLISVDPAATQKEDSDFSAIVIADVFRGGSDMRIYITEASNERLTFFELQMKIQALVNRCRNEGRRPVVLVESIQSQTWLAQELDRAILGVEIHEIKPQSSKEDRLRAAAGFMEAGQVWLPATRDPNITRLAEQIVGFGREAHDDLVDSCSQLILYAAENSAQRITIPSAWRPEFSPI